MAEIQVTSWGTREPLQNDPGAPMHDCLWEIAQEQAVLDRMKQTGESWEAAGGKVSQGDIRKQLDTVISPKSKLTKAFKKPKATWVEPKFFADVEYRDITSEGLLRQSSFKGLSRDDKS